METTATSGTVYIVGGGLAGLTAALELQKRNYDVVVLEKGRPDHPDGGGPRPTGDQDSNSLGGKFGPHLCDQCFKWHEHTHHIFMNWYHNFWKLAAEVLPEDNEEFDRSKYFEPRETVNYLRAAEGDLKDSSIEARTTSITNEGSPGYVLQNILSGPASPADMFLYKYSLLDFASKPYRHKDILDIYSVNGFMRSRWYATATAAKFHQRFLNVAFANASFQTSGETYKRFIQFSMWDPVPTCWVMKQGVREAFINSLRSRLEQKGKVIRLNSAVTRVVLNDPDDPLSAGNKVRRVVNLVITDPISGASEMIELKDGDSVVLAVPLDDLLALTDEDLYAATDNLARVHSLRSETISALEVRFDKHIEGIPREHTALVDSKYQLSLFDYSQVSKPGEKAGDRDSNGKSPTRLTISVSEFDALDSWDLEWIDPVTPYATLAESPRHEALRDRLRSRRSAPRDRWAKVKRLIMNDLVRFLPEVPWPAPDSGNVCLVRNARSRLFLNDVHDWDWQPEPTCEGIGNLFLAGEYVQNDIDAVTVESAIVTGLQAVNAVMASKKDDPDKKIDIVIPENYPPEMISAAVLGATPLAAAAKTWAAAKETTYDPLQMVSDSLKAVDAGWDLWMKSGFAWWRAMRYLR